MFKSSLILCGALLAAAMVAPWAWSAQSAVLGRGAELKAERYTDAATVAKLAQGARVELVRRQGGWFEVRAGRAAGWVRAEALVLPAASPQRPAPATGVLALESGRAGRGDLIATTGVRGFAKPASSGTHALIMSISAYRGGIPHLRGSRHDIESARVMAQRMGVPEANIHVWKDDELTLDGMRRALDEFETSVLDNDQVFIYYSGHGGRQRVSEPGAADRCAESLVAVDGYGFVDTELESRLRRLSAKAQKVIVFLDACHAGGAATRSAATPGAAFVPKSWQGRSDGGEACVQPTNVVTRGIRGGVRSVGRGTDNFVYIAAAREDEVALDQPDRGGVASQAWLACMAGDARDRDGSGGLSAEEIRACAQEKINAQLGGVQGFLPHHVVVTGNGNMVLSYAQDPQPAPAAPAAAAASPLAALHDIYSNRDDRRLVTLATGRPHVRIGRDPVEFTLTSREAGYVYLLMVGSDGRAFDVLFPNQLDRNNVIEAGQTLKLPRSSWQLTAQGPAGKNALLAIVADAPKDFSGAGAKPAGPFSNVPAASAQALQLATTTSGDVRPEECEAARTTRNLAVQRRCSGAYGAAMLTLEEVE